VSIFLFYRLKKQKKKWKEKYHKPLAKKSKDETFLEPKRLFFSNKKQGIIKKKKKEGMLCGI
jgi:hypothetical protein